MVSIFIFLTIYNYRIRAQVLMEEQESLIKQEVLLKVNTLMKNQNKAMDDVLNQISDSLNTIISINQIVNDNNKDSNSRILEIEQMIKEFFKAA